MQAYWLVQRFLVYFYVGSGVEVEEEADVDDNPHSQS